MNAKDRRTPARAQRSALAATSRRICRCDRAPSGPTSSTSAGSTATPAASPTIRASPRPPTAPRKITYIDGDKGVLLYRGYPIEQLAREVQLRRGLLPAAQRRAADQGRVRELPQHHHAPHHGARADDAVLHRLPPRRASDGHHVRLGRRAVGVLSRLHRHQRSPAARHRQPPPDRQDADARGHGLQVFRSASPSSIRATTSTTPPTSCRCASRCRASPTW